MPFMAISAGLGAVGSIATGIMGSNAASAAAKAQQQAAQQATNAELGMFSTAQGDLQPFMQGGTNALAAWQQALGIGPGGGGPTSPLLQMLGIGPNGQPTGAGINPATFQASPGYQFQLQQGQNAVTNSAAARGGLGGNALKALQQYGSGLANQSWNQYLGQANGGWNDVMRQLSGLSGMGESAAGSMAGGAMTMGGQMGQNLLGAGNARAAGIVGANNALTKGISGATQSLMDFLNGPNASNMFAATSYDPSSYGYTGDPNSAGAATLQQLGFFNPLMAAGG